MATNKKRSRASAVGNRGKGRGASRQLDASYIPQQKPVATAATTRRGRQVKPTEKVLDFGLEIEDANGDPHGDFFPKASPVDQGLDLFRLQEEDARNIPVDLPFDLPPPSAPPPTTSEFDSTVDEIVQEALRTLQGEMVHGRVPIELPTITLPCPSDATIEIEKPWSCRNLFHLYILSYSRGEYHICDLVADTWIREFHKVDASPRSRIWRENKSKLKFKGEAPLSDNGDPNIDYRATDFNSKLLTELYQFTGAECGARLLWADAMALCGSTLEDRLDEQGGMSNWPAELIWNVMRTSLRLMRVRRTLKIEEKFPSAWCERYHEHGKHGTQCYRELHKEQNKAVEESEESDQDEVMEMVEMQPPGASLKHVSFQEVPQDWRVESEEV